MHDLVIRRATLVDGTGAPRRIADLAVDGGLIAAVGDGIGPGRAGGHDGGAVGELDFGRANAAPVEQECLVHDQAAAWKVVNPLGWIVSVPLPLVTRMLFSSRYFRIEVLPAVLTVWVLM